MAKVLGIGGVFFKSPDPKALAAWYEKWLGLTLDYVSVAIFNPEAMPTYARTVWSAFKTDDSYFEPCQREFMVNFVVDDLEGALASVKKGGAEIVGDIHDMEYGRFGWFLDPDGSKVELWEPKQHE